MLQLETNRQFFFYASKLRWEFHRKLEKWIFIFLDILGAIKLLSKKISHIKSEKVNNHVNKSSITCLQFMLCTCSLLTQIVFVIFLPGALLLFYIIRVDCFVVLLIFCKQLKNYTSRIVIGHCYFKKVNNCWWNEWCRFFFYWSIFTLNWAWKIKFNLNFQMIN